MKNKKFFNTKKTIKINLKQKQRENVKNISIHKLRIRITSAMRLRLLCTRKNPEGFLIGHIWNARIVNFKNHQPIFGGLFCESILVH